MVFIVQSQTEGEENRIRLFVVDQIDLETCVLYVDSVLGEIKTRYEQWGLGSPEAWKTKLSHHTFQGVQGTAFSFAFDKEMAEQQG